jgi:hypothetical protein
MRKLKKNGKFLFSAKEIPSAGGVMIGEDHLVNDINDNTCTN